MDWAQLGAVGGLIVVALGLVEVVKGFVRKRSNGQLTDKPDDCVSKLECLQTQNTIRDMLDAKLDSFRTDLQFNLEQTRKLIEKHEDRFHQEISGVFAKKDITS